MAAFNPSGETVVLGSFNRFRTFFLNQHDGTWQDAGHKQVDNMCALAAPPLPRLPSPPSPPPPLPKAAARRPSGNGHARGPPSALSHTLRPVPHPPDGRGAGTP